jgi:hypothetical protein
MRTTSIAASSETTTRHGESEPRTGHHARGDRRHGREVLVDLDVRVVPGVGEGGEESQTEQGCEVFPDTSARNADSRETAGSALAHGEHVDRRLLRKSMAVDPPGPRHASMTAADASAGRRHTHTHRRRGKEKKNMKSKQAFLGALVLAGAGIAILGVRPATATDGDVLPMRAAIEFSGTDIGEVRDIDGTSMMCFDGVFLNAETGQVIGTGSDCLDLGSIEGGDPFAGESFEMSNTTSINLPAGPIVTRQRPTIAPVVQGVTGATENAVTHVTGDMSRGTILRGTGAFSGLSGSVRLHGAVDMSGFTGAEGSPIGFNCVFLLYPQ